ncbi:MAG: NUDIX domain-containing protein [Erysipelotrichaceae bacterium]|nr:NUDIX domain-containing protein [Erysipelotrichaceae bacterium]
MEIWDLYNKHREKIGKDHIRGQRIQEGYYHIVVHVWIRNKQGKFIISQRAANRKNYPLKWECVGGSVLKGENSFDGAVREVMEEVGVNLDHLSGENICSYFREQFNDIVDVWLFEYDGELQLQNATTDEVVDCKWMSYNDIKSLYDMGMLVDTLNYFFDIFRPDGNFNE